MSRTVKVEGLCIRYLSAGGPAAARGGRTLLLLHGGGEDASSWRWVIPGLARRHRVLAPDLPGSGGSELVGRTYRPGYFGRFAAGFLAALEVEEAVVVGHSLGGLAAVQMALADPGRASSLVLVAGAGLGPEVHPMLAAATGPGLGELCTLWAMTPLGQLQRVGLRALGAFEEPLSAPWGWYASQAASGFRPGLLWDQLQVSRRLLDQGGQKESVRERLAELDIPALVVWGDRDSVLPLSHGEEAVRRLRRGRLSVLSGCGHMPQIERPEKFLKALEAFLAEADLAGPRPAREGSPAA